MKKDFLPENEKELLRIFRLLKPDFRNELLDTVHSAYSEEKYGRKSLEVEPASNGDSMLKLQGLEPCKNISNRRKK